MNNALSFKAAKVNYQRPIVLQADLLQMSIAPDFSSFWSADVHPNKVLHVVLPPQAHATLTSATISQIKDNKDARGVLYARVNHGTEAALFPFTVGHCESVNTDLFFASGDIIDFYVKGAEIPVQIKGQIFGDYSLQIEEVDPQQE